MNKKQIADIINYKTNISKRTIEKVLTCFIETIKNSLINNEVIRLNNFGKWLVKEYKSKLVYNPIKNKYIIINKKYLPIFKKSNNFKINLIKTNK